MIVKEILETNGYASKIKCISEDILNMDTGICDEIREIPEGTGQLFEGIELYNSDDDSKMILINTGYNDDEDYLPLYILYYGTDGYPSIEIQYDEKCELVAINDFR